MKHFLYFIVLIMGFSSCSRVYRNEVVVVERIGKLNKVKYQGSFLNPFNPKIKIVSINMQEIRDLHTIKTITEENIGYTYRYTIYYKVDHLKAEEIASLYKTSIYSKRREYENYINDVMKSTLTEIYLKNMRGDYNNYTIEEELNKKLNQKGFIIDRVYFVDIRYPYKYSLALEAKSTTKYEIERKLKEAERDMKVQLIHKDSSENKNKSFSYKTKKALNEQAQNTIIKFTSKLFKSYNFHENYFFSNLTRHKTKKAKELEILIDKKNSLISNRGNLEQKKHVQKLGEIDSLINIKKSEITKNEIHSDFSMKNIIVLQKYDSHNEYIETIVESKYFMNNTLDNVKKVEELIHLELPETLNGTYKDFFYENPLHDTDDYKSDKESDKKFYSFFKDRLSTFENKEKKSEFLLHALKITNLTKRYKKYAPEKLVLLIAEQWVKEKYSNSYNDLRFSKINKVFDFEKNSEHVGYELYIEVNFKEGKSKKCFYITFNTWLEIFNIENIAPPYEKHFK